AQITRSIGRKTPARAASWQRTRSAEQRRFRAQVRTFLGCAHGRETDAPAEHRLRGLAPARPPTARTRRLGPAAPGLSTTGSRAPRPSRRARRDGDLLHARDDRRELPRTHMRDRGARTRAGITRLRARPRARADARAVRVRRPPKRRDDRTGDGTAADRLPSTRVLDHAPHAVGLRDPLAARVSLRFEPVRLA